MLAAALAPVEADDPVSTSVSFNREVIRIIQRKCEPCHAPGGLAMSLSDYASARAWGRAIREELVEHRMPPAIVARGYGRYETDPSLNAREMATFLTWLDGGMPRGDEADRPRLTASAASGGEVEGGVRLVLPEQRVPAGEDLVVRRVTVDAGAAAGRPITRVELRPGNRRVLRGAVIFGGPAEAGRHVPQWIGGWLPWQHTVVPPPPHTFQLRPDSALVVDLYYRGADTELADRSTIDISFAGTPASGGIDDLVLDAAPDAARPGRASARATLAQPTRIWAIHPAPDASIRSMELRAERPDRSVEVLLWIPKARADWPLALVMQEPVSLPAGSTLSLVVETDGSSTVHPRVTLSVLR